MDRLNELQQQEQQRQEAVVAEYRLARKVLASIGPKMKELGYKTVNTEGKEVKLPVEEPLRRAHLLITIGKKAKLIVQRYLVEERDLFPDAD